MGDNEKKDITEGIKQDANTESTEADRTEITLAYKGVSGVSSEAGKNELSLHGNIHGPSPIRLNGTIEKTILIREAFASLYDIVSSDQTYKPKDRTAYLAYKNLKKQSATMLEWEARQAYFDWMERNDPSASLVLDPIISLFPDKLLMEVFSKDEGIYAALGIDLSAVKIDGELTYGTTNIDYSQELFDGIQQMRSYRETLFSIIDDSVQLETATAPGEKSSVIEKKVKVPYTWLRGFLQIQSAGILVQNKFKLAPIDLYNLLRHLRLNKDQKKKGRAIRIELVPGEYPRLVLEPWELVLNTTADIYRGSKAEIFKLWGRRRLKLLERLLPYASDITVHLLGSGLPSFFVVTAGSISMTLALTGFTSADWAQSTTLDLLLPRNKDSIPEFEPVLNYLAEKRFASSAAIAKDLNIKEAKVLEALQMGCQQGKLLFDLESFRYRPLTDAPIDEDKLTFRNQNERSAYDLLAQKEAVSLDMENHIFGVGVELTGTVKVASEKMEYGPKMTIDDEGRVRKASCTCSFFRKHQLKQGPCPHMIALRILQVRLEAERKSEDHRKTLTTETRTYARRAESGEHIYQLTLENKRIHKRWGLQQAKLRKQSFVYNSIPEARDAYFSQIDELESKGYLDTTR
ncbi:MAG: SWIM zinc finger family protein [bacterium]|nr:SWIM zinc finger family protein [bacterium]